MQSWQYGTSTRRRRVLRRQVTREARDDVGGLWASGEVLPFVRVVAVIVQLIGAVRVADVAIALVPYRVVAVTVGHHGRLAARRRRIAQQRGEALTFDVRGNVEAGELGQGRVEIHERDS